LLEFFDYVYAEQVPHLEEQKATYADYLATFEDAEPIEGLQRPQPSYAGDI
jgi:hypothetical protein